jgi:CarboxypepD_reg-like domain
MKISFIGLFALLSFFSLAQEQEVMSGIVVDSATFSPLPYVSIRIKNTYKGTSTNLQGEFRLIATRKDTLVLSLVGYETIEIPTYDWEASVIRLAENPTILQTITVQGIEINPYEGLFDEQNEIWRQKKADVSLTLWKWKRNEKKLKLAKEENLRAQTYVDVVIKNPDTKANLIKKHGLTETQYYTILEEFNRRNQTIMYYLTAPELMSLLNTFFARRANK